MHPVTAEREQKKERYSWAEVVGETSWRRRKDGEDFGKNGGCLQQDGEKQASGALCSEPQQDEGQSREGLTG